METMNYKSLAIPPATLGSTGMSKSGAVTGKLMISSKLDPEQPLAPRAPISRFYTALVTGDLRSLQVLTERYQDVNMVFEISENELEWQVKSQASYRLSGLWALEERQELSTPLCLAARHGHLDCLRHLLCRGADPNGPGGQGPLHEACQGGHSDCVELLLEYRANPNLQSDEGLAPLCSTPDSLRCARLLLRHGAAVGQPIEAGGDTALHVAARHRLCYHARLYLQPGILCGHPPGVGSDSLQLFRLLAAHGADVEARDEGGRSPLRRACGAPRRSWRGADANAIHYDGVSPLRWALQERPHLTVQLLLNHGSRKIWPPPFVKVLKSCAAVPEVIEVLFNSYSQIPVCQEWAKVVPEEVFQPLEVALEPEHFPAGARITRLGLEKLLQDVQQAQPARSGMVWDGSRPHRLSTGLFGLAGRARCLQHWCHSLIPLLPLPRALRDFLLLEPQGVVM
ncbi:LOW QUALITY PROTEIN: ankyrin repeat and SOCS box protein 18 [Acridotheres tristis]